MGPCCPPQGLAVASRPASPAGSSFVPAQTRSCQQPAGSPSGGRPLCQGLRCQPGTWWHHSHSSHQRRPAEGQGRARVCLTPDLATQPRRHVRGRRLQSRSTAPAPPWSRGPRSGSAPSPRLRPLRAPVRCEGLGSRLDLRQEQRLRNAGMSVRRWEPPRLFP